MPGLPSSKNTYVQGIRRVLPPGSVHPELRYLKRYTAEQACPPKGESLLTWAKTARRNRQGRLPITLVVGESVGPYRQPRQPGSAGAAKRLTMACTSDGVAGARAVIGLLREARLTLQKVDFNAVVDEWGSAGRHLSRSHLVVIGSPEVNVCATFLHGLVKDFHFGQQVWPPNLPSMGNTLAVSGWTYVRNPYEHEINDCGGVFLLRNPWNPRYRVLWIAGLTGIATGKGCEFVASGWGEYQGQAGRSIAVVFGRDVNADGKEVFPLHWLTQDEGEFRWVTGLQAALREPRRPRVGPRPTAPGRGRPRRRRRAAAEEHVFLSYCSEDRELVGGLWRDLRAMRMRVWWDGEIEPGRDWQRAIAEALQRSYAFVACFSANTQERESSRMFQEVLAAIELHRSHRPGRSFLFPVRLSECEIPAFDIDGVRTLADLQYVDLFPSRKRGKGLAKLLKALRSAWPAR